MMLVRKKWSRGPIAMFMSLMVLGIGLFVGNVKASEEIPLEDQQLLQAATSGDVNGVKAALASGANIEATEDEMTPLSWAAFKGHGEVVKQLLDAGANLEAADDMEQTPIMLAVWNRHGEVVGQLLKAGANIEATDDLGRTPLIVAAQLGSGELVGQLLGAGAKPTTQKQIDKIPYLSSEKKQKMTQIIEKYERYVQDSKQLLQKKHFPLLFLIDQYESEKEKPVNLAGYLMSDSIVKEALYPIVANKALINNLISEFRKGKENIYKPINNWNVYDVPETQFTVWIPKIYSHIYQQFFNIESFSQYNPLNPDENLTTSDTAPFGKSALEKIFSTPGPDYTWDILLTGHNLLEYTPLANKDTNELLSYFNEHNVGTLYALSYNPKDRNALLLRGIDQLISTNHKYLFIVGVVTDQPVLALATPHKFINTFFMRAAEWDGGDRSRDDILEAIVHPTLSTGDQIHGYEGLVRLWQPGGVPVETYDSNEILSIGKKFTKQNQPIIVEDQRVVAWYPSMVNTVVEVEPMQFSERVFYRYSWSLDKLFIDSPEDIRTTFWQNVPMASETLLKNTTLEKFTYDNRAKYPILRKLISKRKSKNVIKKANQLMYPAFIPMKSVDTNIGFKHIIAQGKSELTGVLKFIRDTFLDVSPVSNGREQKIYIASLEGINDIPLHIQTARASKNILEPANQLEKILQDRSGKKIELHNVMIETLDGGKEVHIAFQVDGQWFALKTTLDPTQDTKLAYPWEFKVKEEEEARALQQSFDEGISMLREAQ